tara:strand:- start:544 stop:2094 length:1551 start_codon:yes stop_codon:yes gene_type:complete
MTNLLYYWNFTNDQTNSNVLNNFIYDNISSLSAKIVSRDTISLSDVSIDENGINLNNSDGSGGICIDLLGLDNIQLGGNITIEMVIKNIDLTRDTVYFQTIRDVENEQNNDSAFITCKYSSVTKLLVRTDTNINSGYNFRTASVQSNQINNTNFFHYIFTIKYDSGTSSLKIFINGTQQIENTANLTSQLINTLRQSNLFGTQKNSSGATYFTGIIKYFKIYQNAMTSSEANTTYNNYNNAPYWSNYSLKTNIEKFIRRHTDIDNYFIANPSILSFIMDGNQLGLINGNESYSVHKFVNEDEIDISIGYHYIPLKGQNQYIILKNNLSWYKITQTSIDDQLNTTYKYELSTNSGASYSEPITGQLFGDTFTDDNITIGFGGVESGASSANICFLKGTPVMTDQGEINIENITSKYTINKKIIIKLIIIPNKFNYIIEVQKNALGENIPSRTTFMSKEHGIFINGKLIRAKYLVNNKTILIKYIGKHKIYNILMKKYDKMMVNNMLVETLDPKWRPY